MVAFGLPPPQPGRRVSSSIGLEDPRLGLDDLAERPQGHALAVGEAAALAPAEEAGLRVRVGAQLGDEARLPDSGLADHRHELHRELLRRPLEDADQERLLELAADERGPEALADVAAEARARRLRAPERKRRRLPFHRYGRQRLVVENPARRPARLLADGDGIYRRGALDPGGGVDDVAGDDPLSLLGPCADGDHRLAGVDPDPHPQLEPRLGLVQLGDRLEDPQARPHRPLGIVLVRDRRPEGGHHGVADELLDRAVVALDLLAQAGVVGPDTGAYVLRVLLLGGGGEPDEIAEEDGDDLPLLDRCGPLG